MAARCGPRGSAGEEAGGHVAQNGSLDLAVVGDFAVGRSWPRFFNFTDFVGVRVVVDVCVGF